MIFTHLKLGRVSETQLQVGEKLNCLIWLFKSQHYSKPKSIYSVNAQRSYCNWSFILAASTSISKVIIPNKIATHFSQIDKNMSNIFNALSILMFCLHGKVRFFYSDLSNMYIYLDLTREVLMINVLSNSPWILLITRTQSRTLAIVL